MQITNVRKKKKRSRQESKRFRKRHGIINFFKRIYYKCFHESINSCFSSQHPYFESPATSLFDWLAALLTRTILITCYPTTGVSWFPTLSTPFVSSRDADVITVSDDVPRRLPPGGTGRLYNLWRRGFFFCLFAITTLPLKTHPFCDTRSLLRTRISRVEVHEGAPYNDLPPLPTVLP